MKVGGGLQALKEAIDSQKSTLNIPLNEVKIYHQNKAKICSYGGIFKNNKLINESLNSSNFGAYQQDFFDYLNQLSFFTIKSKKDLKAYIEKLYFTHLSPNAKHNKKILNNPTKPKILFFCAWFSNMYHFVFEAYARLLILKKYAKDNHLDFYLIAPPKYRGFKKYHHWFISQILEIENIPKDKILYLDFQNYDIQNVYFCSNPQCNDKYILPAIYKLQEKLYDRDFKDSAKRIFISRKKSQRRHLINEEEIFETLKEYGFSRIYMEDYTLKEKINLMMNANIVLSIDGTSLINGLFMATQNAKLIALRSKDMSEHTLLICSVRKDIEFLPIICEVIAKNDTKSKWIEGDLYLQKEYLEQKLQEYKIEKISYNP